MANDINKEQYIGLLKETIIPTIKMDFTSNTTYSGKETIGEILINENINVNKEFIQEGILSLPINKIKSIVKTLEKNSKSIEGLKKSVKIFGSIASRVNVNTLKNKALQLAETKDIDAQMVNGSFEQVMRIFGAIEIAAFLFVPLTWLVIIVALFKSGDGTQFMKNMSDSINEIGKSIESKDSKFEQSMAVQAWVIKLLAICLIPPWFQSFILMPIIGVLAFIAYIIFLVDFLNMFERGELK